MLCMRLTTHEPIKETGFLSRSVVSCPYCFMCLVVLLCLFLCCSTNYLPSHCVCVLTSHEPSKATEILLLVLCRALERTVSRKLQSCFKHLSYDHVRITSPDRKRRHLTEGRGSVLFICSCFLFLCCPPLSQSVMLCMCLTTHEPIKATGFLSRSVVSWPFCFVCLVVLLCLFLCCSPNYLPSG